MNCKSCGEEFQDAYRFCPACGDAVGSSRFKVQGSELEVPGSSGASGSGDEGAADLSMGFEKTVVQGSGCKVGEVQGSGGGVQDSREEDQSMGFAQTVVSATPHSALRTPHSEAEELSTRYELLEEIGRGGFARVWRARDRKLDRLVAVKRLIEPVVKDHTWEITVQRFHREAQAIAGLSHRNIVSVYDVGADGEGDYIVMELIPGGSLREYLKEKGKLEEAEAVRLICEVARGLSYGHKKGLVHRDIKPENILLAEEEGGLTPKIVDFGLARVGTDSELSMTGYGMGTPWYMPPEQRRDAKNVNHTADIYALGKTLYELLTGEIPDQVDPDRISPGLSRVILKCVKNNPEDRYFSADLLLGDLEGGPSPSRGPAAASRVESVSETMSCPSCGAVNEEGVKFCQSCGEGLYAPCPECGRENPIQKAFCGGCGTSGTDFKALEAVAGKARAFATDKHWPELLTLREQLPPAEKLKGSKATQTFQQLHALFRTGESKSTQQNALINQIKTFRKRPGVEEVLTGLVKHIENPKNEIVLGPVREYLHYMNSDGGVGQLNRSEWLMLSSALREAQGMCEDEFLVLGKKLAELIDKFIEEPSWNELQKNVKKLEHEQEWVQIYSLYRGYADNQNHPYFKGAAEQEADKLENSIVHSINKEIDKALAENDFMGSVEWVGEVNKIKLKSSRLEGLCLKVIKALEKQSAKVENPDYYMAHEGALYDYFRLSVLIKKTLGLPSAFQSMGERIETFCFKVAASNELKKDFYKLFSATKKQISNKYASIWIFIAAVSVVSSLIQSFVLMGFFMVVAITSPIFFMTKVRRQTSTLWDDYLLKNRHFYFTESGYNEINSVLKQLKRKK